MVLFNYSGREINAKIVYYGPGLSGKTTNLEYIYNKIAPHLRGKMVSMKTKTDRTLFFDFLPISGGEVAGFGIRFLLYTVPGQVYYNATRKLVLKGADAIVFVADSQAEELAANRESLNNLKENLKEYGKDLEEIPMVIQYNKRDLPNALPIEKLEQELNPRGVPSFEAIATTGKGVFETLTAATQLVIKELRKQLGKETGDDESGGQEITFGLTTQPEAHQETVQGGGEADTPLTQETSSNVPSPGVTPSPTLTEPEPSCPPVTQTITEEYHQTPEEEPQPTIEEEGHEEPEKSQSSTQVCEKGLTIPIKVRGKGKPSHVIVNLAVDVQIITEDEEQDQDV